MAPSNSTTDTDAGDDTEGEGEPVTVPREDAFDAAKFHLTTADGTEWELLTVDATGKETGVPVNGRTGVAETFSCEAVGGDRDRFFGVRVSAEARSDTAYLEVWENGGPHGEPDRDIDVVDARVEPGLNS